MPSRKIAISMPEEVLAAVDELARRAGLPRSTFIANVLKHVAARKRDDDIRAAVDEVFGHPGLRDEQRSTAEAFRRAGPWAETQW